MIETAQRFFGARPESVGQARKFASETLTEWGLAERVDDIRLCVSELATNALVHGTVFDHGFLVRLDVEDDIVRLEVHDSRRRRPQPRQASSTDLSGRGLALVAELADEWGVHDRSPLGKIVWSSFKAAGGTTT
ncbi:MULTISPECIES: ATP-binding protein [unclassified Streptomyces]|uniref:ATP-binding protein n=1 Tax=unclassified Streptomyces TaxID=2593676 RepID=UPI002ED34790|nr:ATP-binding protein [Streptomyces sp. NBC_00891]WSY06691.1 ATP-binding protein [Streptomyces sp. NBC_00890]WSZ08315.1 ATP-binding protein [Streptomyces sp. NBC_00869]WSZ24186.1 ATP-binding protein [Streptomyces sp. NBC_00870]